MSRSPYDLCPRLRAKAGLAIMELLTQGIPVMITDTLRTEAEQKELLIRGASKVVKSKHLPQEGCISCQDILNSQGTKGLSHAIDVCLVEQFNLHGPEKLKWDTSDPAWEAIGKAMEKVGLRWGGRWVTFKDYAHAELR